VLPGDATLSAFFPEVDRLLPGGRRAGLVVVGVGHKEQLPKRPAVYFGFQRDQELRTLHKMSRHNGWRVFVVDPEDNIKLLLQGALSTGAHSNVPPLLLGQDGHTDNEMLAQAQDDIAA
jgi:hypothetical protein